MMYDWQRRRTLVTGATGVVGSWLCEELHRRGAHVVAFVLDDDPQSRFFRDGIAASCTVVRGNVENLPDVMRAVGTHDIEVVFHLAAQTLVGTALRDPLGTFESNIRGTYNLLEAARRLAPLVRSFVLASSDKAYGASPILPYTEDMPLRGRHPYDVSKSCADLLASSYAHTYDLPVAIARCGNIYGGGDLNWSRIVPGTIRSLLDRQDPVLRSDGRDTRDYIYVRDVVSAYLLLAEYVDTGGKAGEAFNFSSGARHSVLEVVDAIGSATGLLAHAKILATATMEIRDQALDTGKARDTLGWQPQWSLDRGLQETAEWYRTHFARRSASVLV